MDVFVARQPIFDVRDRVVGYELLHRVDSTNRFDGTEAAVATGQLLSDHLLTDTWHQLTGGRRAWVNFPASLLESGSALLVPPERIVVELLEDIVADDGTVAACRELVDRGYVLAADDVVDSDDPNPLLDVAQIVKVDFRAADAAARAGLVKRFAGQARLLAEKVETRTEQLEAVELGYELLQGYFLRQPAVVSHRAIDRSSLGLLAAVATVARAPMDFDEVEAAVKRDVALTDRFLRYLNSAAFGWRDRVRTIRQALVRLGEDQVRRWITVNALSAVNSGKPAELVVSTLVRARMCELLADVLPSRVSGFDLFLTGLYSQIHLLIGAEHTTTVRQAPIPPSVAHALIECDGPLWAVLQLVVAWEGGDWDRVRATLSELGIEAGAVSDCYAEAVDFADEASGPRTDPPLSTAAILSPASTH